MNRILLVNIDVYNLLFRDSWVYYSFIIFQGNICLGFLLSFLLIILIFFVLLKRRIEETRKILLDSIISKDVSNVYRILMERKWIARKFLDRSLVLKAFDLIFYRAEFDLFLNIVKVLKIFDERIYFLDKDIDVIGLDIETEIDFERMPREIGLVAISRDWKIMARLLIKDFASFINLYGIEPQVFLKKLLEKGFRIIVGHNVYSFDREILSKWGIDISDKLFIDTYIISLLVLPEVSSHSLEFLSELFGIEYTPHIAHEDAYASALLLPPILVIARKKNVLNDLKSISYPPISGLKEINVPEDTYLILNKEKKYYDKNILVTLDASDYVNSWYPYRIDLERLERMSLETIYERLVNIAIRSFIAGGGRDPERLRKLPFSDKNYLNALNSVLDKVIVKNPLKNVYNGVVVEYRYLKDFMEHLNDYFKDMDIVFNGAYLLYAYYSDCKDILRWASKRFRKVFLKTLFDLECEYDNMVIERIRNVKPIILVNEGMDKSLRHIRFLARLLAGFTSKRTIVIVSNIVENLIADNVASFNKTRILIENVDKHSLIWSLERIYRFSKANYNIIFFSTISANRKYNAFLYLKYLSEICGVSGTKIFLLNTYIEDLDRRGLLNIAEKINVKPVMDFDVKITPFAYRSISEALKSIEKIVDDIWGFKLRPYQRKCIARLLIPYIWEGRNITKPLSIVILPTGSGKSLIFQSIALLLKRRIRGTTVVVSPLLALIEDQVNSLRKRGIRVCSITSMARENFWRYIYGMARGYYDIVYITPEQLEKEEVRKIFEKTDINYLILDEIHTMYKWGKTFRPSYSYLANYLRKRREEGYWIPLAGFTATLPEKGIKEVVEMLTGSNTFSLENIDFKTDFKDLSPNDFYENKILKGPILRDNIVIDVRNTLGGEDRLKALTNLIRELSQWSDKISHGKTWIGLIYTGFVRSSRDYENAPFIARYLSNALGERVLCFHGQIKDSEKRAILNILYDVSDGKYRKPRIIVATKAFGMGVDLPNIRWVIHVVMPESIEDYYQEIGRGGRDGTLCKAVMLYSSKDHYNRLRLLKRNFIDPKIVADIYYFLKGFNEGSILPIIDMIPILGKKLRIKFLEQPYDIQDISEHIRNLVIKALNILSELGVIDFDIIHQNLTSIKSAIRLNFIDRNIDIEDIYSIVANQQLYQILSLYMMNQYSIKVMNSIDKDRVARKIINNYLSRSIDEIYRELLSKRDKIIQESYLKQYTEHLNKLMVNGEIKIWVHVINKNILACLMAYILLLYILKKGENPLKIMAIVPYGYGDIVKRCFRKKVEEFGLPLIEPLIIPVSKKHNISEIIETAKGIPLIFILSTNKYMKYLSYNLRTSLSSSIYEIKIEKYRYRRRYRYYRY